MYVDVDENRAIRGKQASIPSRDKNESNLRHSIASARHSLQNILVRTAIPLVIVAK